MATSGGRASLTESVRTMASTLLAIAQTRLELLGNEFEIEKLRVLRMLLLAQALMFAMLIVALLATSLLTLWLWEFRLGILALCIALFGAAAWWAYRSLMAMVQRPESTFASSLTELQEDLRRLKAASGHATTPD
ncbi:MAG TPA: phage holin family protein [Burkholderiaceae bacterium]|nr:phage holin family protein [Burkholderiaceae bacterium]HQZ07540.1 phage holin family protein [Burkholderiaceae bacterium]HRA61987.1 phage holin family protein [Burkholderiaceae bacterium]